MALKKKAHPMMRLFLCVLLSLGIYFVRFLEMTSF